MADGASPERVVLVTGSARGIGRAVAEHFAALGDRVHVVWRSQSAAADDLVACHGERAHRADLVREADARDLVDAVCRIDGGLDVLVHAVGEYASAPLEETDGATLRRMLASNVESAFHLFSAARSSLRASRDRGGTGGRAVFFGTSGLSGLRGRRKTAAYAAAKSALAVLVRGWALEEAPHGVTVNLVSPGHVPHADAHPDTLDPELLAKIPLGRPGEGSDLARAVAWLCSGEASYTTGTDLYVTGGWML